jgi:hypothetical protein
MRPVKLSVPALVSAGMVAVAASAHADPDADFNNQLHDWHPLMLQPNPRRQPAALRCEEKSYP